MEALDPMGIVSHHSLHADFRIHEHDLEGLERPCVSTARPPFAPQRLSRAED
jgi:hypothetical protein